MGHLINEISRIKGIMGILSEGESQFESSDKKTIDEFVELVKKELKIDNDIVINLQNDKEGIKTTAVYKYQDNDEDFEDSEIKVYTLGRALVDVLRSIAHELVHHMQNENGDLEGKQSNVGGPIEDEANSVAGEMIKKYGLINPDIYGDDDKEEMGEQEDGGSMDGDSDSANSNVGTWESGLSRGPANTLTIDVWDSGVNRGKGNPVDSTSTWESGISRGKSNPLN